MLKSAKLFAFVLLATSFATTANAASYYAPGMPYSVRATTVSDNQIDVTWIPDKDTGKLPLNRYQISYWKNVVRATKTTVVSYTNSVSLNDLDPSTWYIINVSSCNAVGCSSADTWAWKPTTPYTSDVLNFKAPLIINGGKASTVCFNATLDGGSATAVASFKKTLCPATVPYTGSYPVVDPTATRIPGK
jgi:hypothetical protein